MRTRALGGLLAGIVVLGIAPTAAGQQLSGTESESETSEQLIARGVELRKQGHDAEALAAFERAHSLHPSARARAQIALAHQALAQWLEAEQALILALRDTDDVWVERNRVYLQESLAAVQEHLASLVVDCNVPGAELWLDGTAAGRLPNDRPLRIVAGDVLVEVRAPGYEVIQRRLHAEPKSQVNATFTFVAPLPILAPSTNVKPTEERIPVRSTPSPISAPMRTAGWLTLEGGGVLLVAGIAGMIVREWEARIYNDDACAPVGDQSRYQRCKANRDIGSAAETLAIGAFVGSGIAAAVGTVLLLRSPLPARTGVGRTFECHPAALGFDCRATF